jgi:hypothetical protein
MSKKRRLLVAVLVLGVAVVIGVLNQPIRVEWHKWRLKDARTDRERLLAYSPRLSWWEQLQMRIMGRMVSLKELDQRIERHTEALVRLRFLQRETFVVGASVNDAELRAAMHAMKAECPWYAVEVVGNTNLVVTTCSKGMKKWHDRAQALGVEERVN